MFINSRRGECRSPHPSVIGSRPRGFSLVEVVVFIMIVSIALVGVLSVMNFTTARSADPLIRKQAIAVAESMLEEISLQNFVNPSGGFSGAATQANRQSFDDISDYDNFTTTGVFPIDSMTAIPGLTGYTVSVTVAPMILGPASSQIASGNARLITVMVTAPDGVAVVLAGYRTAYGS